MSKARLKYTFHNPNTVEAAAGYLMPLFVEVNVKKAEQAVQLAATVLGEPIGGAAPPPQSKADAAELFSPDSGRDVR